MELTADMKNQDKQSLTHDFWMHQALALARQAADQDETPIGALIVKQGKIIGRGFNRRETDQDVTMHAEMIAIREASANLGSWRLDDCILYVTLEPCLMCAGAIIQSRLSELVYGASDPKAGAAGSVTDVFSLQLNHQVIVVSGVLADPCGEILRVFFRKLRQRNKKKGSRAERRQQAISVWEETSARKDSPAKEEASARDELPVREESPARDESPVNKTDDKLQDPVDAADKADPARSSTENQNKD